MLPSATVVTQNNDTKYLKNTVYCTKKPFRQTLALHHHRLKTTFFLVYSWDTAKASVLSSGQPISLTQPFSSARSVAHSSVENVTSVFDHALFKLPDIIRISANAYISCISRSTFIRDPFSTDTKRWWYNSGWNAFVWELRDNRRRLYLWPLAHSMKNYTVCTTNQTSKLQQN